MAINKVVFINEEYFKLRLGNETGNKMKKRKINKLWLKKFLNLKFLMNL
jgi:hypothetical protein